MRIILFLTLTNLTLIYGQKKSFQDTFDKSNINRILLEIDCNSINPVVEEDIKNGYVFIFLNGGAAPIRFSTDETFEYKYNIYFYEQGCVNSQCAENYNMIIFDYLKKVYGKKWMKEIRDDAVGFKKWKKLNNKQQTKNNKQHNE
jgi:hypothetical protein